MKRNLTLIAAIAGVALVIPACKLVMDDESSSQGVYALKLASGDITSWSQDESEGYSEFKASTLESLIDGGSTDYTNEGVVEGFIQKMFNGSKKAEIRVMDFGTESNAASMYSFMDGNNNSKLEASTYDIATAQLNDKPTSGVDAYAHFGQYYIELRFTGFSDKNDARTTAPNFLEVFETKISQL